MSRMSGLAALCLIGTLAGCAKSPTATVSMSYTITPKTPLDSQHSNIAVYNARMEGDTAEFDQKKWSEMTADMVQYELQQAADKHNVPIKLVDREHMKVAMGEKDMAAGGMTDSGDRVASSLLQGATAIITSKVTIKVDKQKGKGRTVDAMSVFGGWGGGGGGVNTTEVEKESRNITVQCQFQLKDAGSNEILVSHSGKPNQHFDKAKSPSPVFGGSKTESDMTPRDKIIAQFIERQLKEFVCKFAPTVIEATVEVKSSGKEPSTAGVNSLIEDDFEGALTNFKKAIAESPNDHQSMFGAGVACEKLKRFDEARTYYRKAKSLKNDNEQYAAAVDRVSEFGESNRAAVVGHND